MLYHFPTVFWKCAKLVFVLKFCWAVCRKLVLENEVFCERFLIFLIGYWYEHSASPGTVQAIEAVIRTELNTPMSDTCYQRFWHSLLWRIALQHWREASFELIFLTFCLELKIVSRETIFISNLFPKLSTYQSAEEIFQKNKDTSCSWSAEEDLAV